MAIKAFIQGTVREVSSCRVRFSIDRFHDAQPTKYSSISIVIVIKNGISMIDLRFNKIVTPASKTSGVEKSGNFHSPKAWALDFEILLTIWEE